MDNKPLLSSIQKSSTLTIFNNDYLDSGYVYVHLKDGTVDNEVTSERKFSLSNLDLNKSIRVELRPGYVVDGINISTTYVGTSQNLNFKIYDVKIIDVNVDATLYISTK